MAIMSTILGVHLLALFLIATYSTLWPRWTLTLNSFAMMRIGAAIADEVPLMVGRNMDKIKILDDLPGWIGDAAEEFEPVGRLGLGALFRLRSRRRYVYYDGDNEDKMLDVAPDKGLG